MSFAFIIAGLLLLILGRKLFWLFVAVIGFILGLTYIPMILPGQSDTVFLVTSLITGLLGALLAMLLQKLAIGLAGLAAGAYVTYYLLQMVTLNVGDFQWLAILAGALLGAVLAGSMYDWALILITSASGAVLITENLPASMPISGMILAGLFIFGIITQAKLKIKE